TVTEGRMRLVDVRPLNAATRREVLRLAGALEDASEHPVARAVSSAARAELGKLPPVESFRSVPGVGVRGVVDGHELEIARGRVSWDGLARAELVVEATVKAGSAEAVAAFERLGLAPVLLTGDRDETARRVAVEVGIEQVIADVLPDQKLTELRRLQGDGKIVAMVGDG